MMDATDSASPKPRKMLNRYLTIAAIALLIAALATGWTLYAAWKNYSANLQAEIAKKAGELAKQSTDIIANEIKNAGEFSNQFVGNLSEQRLSAAYQSTSKMFKQQVDEERFTKLVKGHPALKGDLLWIHFSKNGAPGNSTVRTTGDVMRNNAEKQVTVNIKQGDAANSNVSLVLVDEDGVLKVDQLVLGSDKAP
jgi:hypothetical protein